MKSAFALLLMIATTALAADTDVLGKLDPAWRGMEQRVTRLLGQTGQRTLLDMAYAQVAVDACSGLTLNNPAYEEAFSNLAGAKKRNPSEQRRFENQMMAEFGTYTGLVLAESFLDKAAFCRAVEGIKARRGGPNRFWIAR